MIAIIDYGMGNLRSVEKGFLKVGVDARVVNDSRSVNDAEAVVLPGVGAFRDCMRNLDRMKLIEPILKSVRNGKPYLGICLGLQMLFTESEEFGVYKGLDILKGKVVRFQVDLKVPHMGWNTVRLLKKPPIFDGIKDESYFYFVHSYYVAPDDEGIIAGSNGLWDDLHINGLEGQYYCHSLPPEKSQETGLKILKNFGDFVKRA